MDGAKDRLHIGLLVLPLVWPDSEACARARFIRKGFYRRAGDYEWVRKCLFLDCRRNFSAQARRDDHGMRTIRRGSEWRRALCSGVSGRPCALDLRMGRRRRSVERALLVLARRAARDHAESPRAREPCAEVEFDETGTSEHTKWKPLSLPLVVSPERLILGLGMRRRSYKGPEAENESKTHCSRRHFRKSLLDVELGSLAPLLPGTLRVATGREPMHPGIVKTRFPAAVHAATPID